MQIILSLIFIIINWKKKKKIWYRNNLFNVIFVSWNKISARNIEHYSLKSLDKNSVCWTNYFLLYSKHFTGKNQLIKPIVILNSFSWIKI